MAALRVGCEPRTSMLRWQLLIANPRERLVLVPVLGRIAELTMPWCRHSHGRRVLPTAWLHQGGKSLRRPCCFASEIPSVVRHYGGGT